MEYLEECFLVRNWDIDFPVPYIASDKRPHITFVDFSVERTDGSRFLLEAKGDHLWQDFLESGKFIGIAAWCSVKGLGFKVVTDCNVDYWEV